MDAIGGNLDAFTGKKPSFNIKVDEHVPVALGVLSDLVSTLFCNDEITAGAVSSKRSKWTRTTPTTLCRNFHPGLLKDHLGFHPRTKETVKGSSATRSVVSTANASTAAAIFSAAGNIDHDIFVEQARVASSRFPPAIAHGPSSA